MQLDITLLVLDTQRVDRLSCYGYSTISPHLDKFAADATRFTRAISPAQWTIPAHASIFTGLYSSRHTLFNWEFLLPATFPTIAERLGQAGYFTAGFSNNDLIGRLNSGLERGFDAFTNYIGGDKKVSAGASGPTTLQARIARAASRSRRLKKILLSPRIKPIAVALLGDRTFTKGNTALSLDDAARFMIDRPCLSPGQPLFTFINLMGTHYPYNPPDWAMERFVPQLLDGGLFDGDVKRQLDDFNSRRDAFGRLLTEPLSPGWQTTLNGLYDAEVAVQDKLLGDFFDRLQNAGVLDNTLFIVVSDHGEHLGEKCLIGHAFGAYQELLHVPLLIRDPQGNLARGVTQDARVSTRRIFHTVLTAAGIATPEEEALTLARPGVGGEQSPVFAEAEQSQVEVLDKAERNCPGIVKARGYDQTHLAVYSAGYKLIVAGERCVGLYGVDDDPTESRDLQQIMTDQVEALRQHIRDFTRQSGDVTPGMGPKIDDEALLERLRNLGYMN
jgi:arylsulfatase A-like enzyme